MNRFAQPLRTRASRSTSQLFSTQTPNSHVRSFMAELTSFEVFSDLDCYNVLKAFKADFPADFNTTSCDGSWVDVAVPFTSFTWDWSSYTVSVCLCQRYFSEPIMPSVTLTFHTTFSCCCRRESPCTRVQRTHSTARRRRTSQQSRKSSSGLRGLRGPSTWTFRRSAQRPCN